MVKGLKCPICGSEKREDELEVDQSGIRRWPWSCDRCGRIFREGDFISIPDSSDLIRELAARLPVAEGRLDDQSDSLLKLVERISAVERVVSEQQELLTTQQELLTTQQDFLYQLDRRTMWGVMTTTRRFIVWATAVVIAATGLFPPWVSLWGTSGALQRPLGYYWLFLPPTTGAVALDVSRLLLEWAMVVAISAALFFARSHPER